MDQDWQELEKVRKRCEELDTELDSLLQSLREIRKIKESVSSLPERLQQSEAVIENQKKEIQDLKNIIDSHEQKISVLNNNYAEVLKGFDKTEFSFREIQKPLLELRRRPYDVEAKMQSMEERLKALFFAKLQQQKYIILAMLGILAAGIILFIFYPQ
ncbi:MAG: hypothetical protein C4560_03805 [Nitrospiraceae bacterium]|nr:MAG: hypothetical protein C4560_03805 [Nitrospiraceae bacterium]